MGTAIKGIGRTARRPGEWEGGEGKGVGMKRLESV